MRMTVGILLDFFTEHGYEVLKSPKKRIQTYLNPRLYYPECALSQDYLYLTDEAGYAQIDRQFPAATICILNPMDCPRADENCFVLRADTTLPALLETLLAEFERLVEWDRQLTWILNRDCSLEAILRCSEPILRNPCFFQDAQFHVLASCGTLTEEENPFFAGTLRDGHVPRELFAQMLFAAGSAPPIPASTAVRNLTQQEVMIADCCVDGVPVLHFCLAYCRYQGVGLRDLISHLIHRMETSPGIQRLANSSINMQDHLFAKILDAPDQEGFEAVCESLGLFRYPRFMAICYDFCTQASDMLSRTAKLRAIYSSFWFFRYHEQFFALIGCAPEPIPSVLAAREAFLQQLTELGATYGMSLDLFPASALRDACAQAVYAREHGAHTSYQDVMLQHILSAFFSEHSFHLYCPRAFLELLRDDHSTGNNNLELLYTFLSQNCNATAASRLLHMHRNNILYRIDKIKTKYGFRLDEPEERMRLLALAYAAIHSIDDID